MSFDVARIAQQLKAEIEKDIADVMIDGVARTVRNVHIDAIETEVYNKYSPKYYKRRRELRGLSDRRNIRVIRRGKMGISMTNITRGNSRYGGDSRMRIAESIEYGTGLMAPIGARRFFKKTGANLKRSRAHTRALALGLKNRGYIVKGIKT